MKTRRVRLTNVNYEKVMAHYGYYRRHKKPQATYSDGTTFGILRFWR